MKDYTEVIKKGFGDLKVNDSYKFNALNNLLVWLNSPEYKSAVPQIIYLIKQGYWDYLLDSFYQVIPFGTGGRRGEVGIGPNRINQWTIKSSAQGHSQYLLKKFGNSSKKMGVVIAWDVREFLGNKYFNNDIENPVLNLSGYQLSKSIAEVYAGNGLKVYMFDGVRTTPELSFAVRYLKTISGIVISASHNPPDHNGIKIYDEFGGQLIPPYDELLVNEVTQNVNSIKVIDYKVAQDDLIKIVPKIVDDNYIKSASTLSLSTNRSARIAFTSLHGCGYTSVYPVLKKIGFNVLLDKHTSYPSGKFENIMFNIPNPEVVESYSNSLNFCNEITADILLSADPDADRLGIMVKYKNKWHFLNGNQIGVILTHYVLSKKHITKDSIVLKTAVTTSLISEICYKYNVQVIDNLLVGFKYIGEYMNKLEQSNRIDDFLFGCEESHGYLSGNYVRDKDACVPAIWLSELAGELSLRNQTLIHYLDNIYNEFGYFYNYLTEIRIPGAEGKNLIDEIQNYFRTQDLRYVGKRKVSKIIDYWNFGEFSSESDKISKNMIEIYLESLSDISVIKITLRPSGTEPKIKIYIEVGYNNSKNKSLYQIKKYVKQVVSKIEIDFVKMCYSVINIDYPLRAFLLFSQLPLQDKLKYFLIEPKIEDLVNEENLDRRSIKLYELLKFLGSNPIEKVDRAFRKKNGLGINEYLNLN